MRMHGPLTGLLLTGLALLVASFPSLAGTPIGGIVVKGGKNPGGNAMVLETDERGELHLNGLEAGHYTFALLSSEGPKFGQVDMREPALLTAPAQEASRVAVNPIGGIIVKGGKNPGGNAMVLVVIQDGRMDLTIPEAGNYTFAFSTPDANGKSISQPGVKRSTEALLVQPAQTQKSISEKGIR